VRSVGGQRLEWALAAFMAARFRVVCLLAFLLALRAVTRDAWSLNAKDQVP
jgi:hypothetical protein